MPNRIDKTRNYNPLSFTHFLKIIALFSVFIGHYLGTYSNITFIDRCPFLHLIRVGLQPVSLFFVISGLLFFFAYYNRIRNNEITFLNFFGKKIIRFWPLIVIVATYNFIFMCVSPTVGLDPSANIGEYFLTIFFAGPVLFTGEYGRILIVSWYISILMFCYLIAFLLTKLDKKTGSKAVFVIPILLGIPMIILNLKYPFFNNNIGRGFFNFFIGFFAAFALKLLSGVKGRKKICFRCFLSLFPICYVTLFYFPNIYEQIFIFPHITVTLLFILPIIFILYDLKCFNKFCAFKLIKYLAGISFEFFMLHNTIFMAFYSVSHSILDSWWFMLICLVFSLIISIIFNCVTGIKLNNFLLKKLGYEC